jgi:hypothetical protein
VIEGTVDGKVYPIAIGENGQVLWETTSVAQERDEIWDDWSLGLGETKRETGRGYLFASGFDGSSRGALRLSPFYHNINNINLTNGVGYFMEDVDTSGSTLNLDASSSGSGSVTPTSSLTFEHTVASQDERLLVLAVVTDSIAPPILSATYDGIPMTTLVNKLGITGVDASIRVFFLLQPPTGANDIVISSIRSSTYAVAAGAESFYGVDQDNPFGTAVTGSDTNGTPTITVSTSAGEFVLAVFGLDTNDAFTAGTNETERWDLVQSTDVTGAGFTQAGSDGGVMAPSIDGAASDWVGFAIPIKAAASQSVMYLLDKTKIFRHVFDPDTGLTLKATDTTASGVGGRPARMNSNWYAPMGSGASAQKLTGTTWADVTGTWNADHLGTFQEGVTPKLARVNSTTQNKIELNADTGDVTDTWSGGSSVGDSSTKITDLVEALGLLFPCKEDNLYEFGIEAESRPVIPFIDRGKADSDNGKGSFAFGDEIVYMSKGDLWRYRIGRGALPVGLNTIRSWRKISAIGTPKSGRPAFGVFVGEYWYYLQNEGELSHLIQVRKRREGDPAGHELIQHSILTIPLSKGLGADSYKRLWIKGASTDQTVRDVRVIQLAEDGSLDVENRKGQTDENHDIYFDERNPGRPQDQVQLRRFTVEIEGDWGGTIAVTPYVWRDNAATPEAVGSGSINAAGITTNNWTVGTNDTCYRFRPQLTLTTGSTYTPKNSQPDVLRVIIGIRFPEIIRIVIPADDAVLTGMTAIDAEQNLRRLQNQGVVAFRRPDTIATFNAEIFSVTDTMYATQKGYAHGIQLQLRRWVTT